MCDGTLYEGAKGEDVSRHVPRGRKRVAARKAIVGLAFLATYVLLSPKFSYIQILREEWLRKGRLERYVPEVNERKHGSRRDDRLLEVQLIGIVERTKYYAVWSLAEASSKSSPGARLTWSTRVRVLSQVWDLEGMMRQVEACGIAYRILT